MAIRIVAVVAVVFPPAGGTIPSDKLSKIPIFPSITRLPLSAFPSLKFGSDPSHLSYDCHYSRNIEHRMI